MSTVRSIRKELCDVYRAARIDKSMDWHDAARAASILQILSRMIQGSDFEDRIAALETALAEHKGKPSRSNGHARPAPLERRL